MRAEDLLEHRLGLGWLIVERVKPRQQNSRARIRRRKTYYNFVLANRFFERLFLVLLPLIGAEIVQIYAPEQPARVKIVRIALQDVLCFADSIAALTHPPVQIAKLNVEEEGARIVCDRLFVF